MPKDDNDSDFILEAERLNRRAEATLRPFAADVRGDTEGIEAIAAKIDALYRQAGLTCYIRAALVGEVVEDAHGQGTLRAPKDALLVVVWLDGERWRYYFGPLVEPALTLTDPALPPADRERLARLMFQSPGEH